LLSKGPFKKRGDQADQRQASSSDKRERAKIMEKREIDAKNEDLVTAM
jgi:hypothetical protein